MRGNETGLVEIPANWYLDDLPPMMYDTACLAKEAITQPILPYHTGSSSPARTRTDGYVTR